MDLETDLWAHTMSYLANFSRIFILIVICSTRLVNGYEHANCECGFNYEAKNRIVGGWDATPHDFPWLVAINKKGKLYCGGVIINDRYILTAGHCVKWAPKEFLTIIVKQHNRLSNDGKTLPVSKVILHEQFRTLMNSYDVYDIALIKLKTPIQFTKKVSSICLPQRGSNYNNRLASVAGWGHLGEDMGLADVLQRTMVRVLSPTECKKTKMQKYLTDTLICAFTENSDACQSDSGGPLMFERDSNNWEVIGIISYGIGCGRPSYPGMYTKVALFVDWIYKNTNDAKYCMDPRQDLYK